MKNVQLIGLSALLTMAVACASQSEPVDGANGEQSSQVSGEPATSDPSKPAQADVPAPPPGPAPTPGPAPSPAPGCKPIAKPVGTVNPASVYCAELGYSATGEQCAFPDGSSCEQWSFYRGECGQKHSFCNLHGGTVSNKIEDMGGWTASYALCTLPGGKQCEDAAFAQSCSCE